MPDFGIGSERFCRFWRALRGACFCVPIFIGDDLTITTKSGSVYNIQRLHGIPLNENFIRNAGYVTTTFRAEFPAITEEIDFVSGTVCGESLTINVRENP